MDIAIVSASSYSLPDLVRLLNRGFEDYFISIRFTTDMFSNMLRKDGVDLADSRVLVADDQPCGIALIACRDALHASRLAAMGIAKEARGRGVGSRFMQALIHDARQRGDREMVLEVIEQNEPAVKLYRHYGFTSVRRLVGYTYTGRASGKDLKNDLEGTGLQELGSLISQYGLPDLPWQLSGESLRQMNPPLQAYHSGQAYIAISNPEAEHVVIWSLLVEPQARGHGLASRLLKQTVGRYSGKTWHVPALCPEEFSKVFETAGFEREKLSQWQMKLEL